MSPHDEIEDLVGKLSEGDRALLTDLALELSDRAGGSRGDLVRILAGLDDEQVQSILAVARSMTLPIEAILAPQYGLITPPFAREMRARLQAHHATYETPLDRLGFENAFIAASRAAGREASGAPSRTTRFWDVEVDGSRVGLKSEGARSMRPGYLHISKLSEAAWIQDVRSARTRRERTFELVQEFLAIVDAFYVFRCYRNESSPHYELVEIPVSHFARVLDVPVAAFDSDAPRIPIQDERGPIMEFRLDRSDSKVTVSKIVKSRCRVHAEWILSGTRESP